MALQAKLLPAVSAPLMGTEFSLPSMLASAAHIHVYSQLFRGYLFKKLFFPLLNYLGILSKELITNVGLIYAQIFLV